MKPTGLVVRQVCLLNNLELTQCFLLAAKRRDGGQTALCALCKIALNNIIHGGNL